MGIGFMFILPVIFWIFIVCLIVAVSKSGSRYSRPAGSSATQRHMQNTARKPAGRVSSERPKMQEGLFDMKLDDNRKSHKGFSLGDFLGKSGFDRYETKGQKKDFVNGYDRTVNVKKAKHMQFTHTYDGHEPWDDCLPKEKDPWDKDFYA